MSTPTIPTAPAVAPRTPRGPGRRRTLIAIAVALAVVVPLAFAGIVVGALSGATDRVDAIPAALVNEDQLVTTTGTDGAKQQVLAGRLIVQALTGDDNPAFDWRLMSKPSEAQQALDDGGVYVVLTIPKDFSKSVASLSGDDPQKASFSVTTDDAHDYLASAAASLLASTLQAQLGTQLSQQYIQGLYEGLGTLGTSLGKAADGAGKLADGADQLADGGDQLADGTDQSASGAHQLASGLDSAASGASDFAGGLDTYTDGVDSIAGGLGALDQGAAKTSSGVAQYTAGVSQAADGFDQLNAGIQANPLVDPATKAGMQQAVDGLDELAAAGTQVSSGVAQVVDGVHRSATGAAQISSGSSSLDSGASQLASGIHQSATGAHSLANGLDDLADGASQSASGAHTLAGGAGDLADGLRTGADQVPANDTDAAAQAKLIASPVTHTTTTQHAVDGVGPKLGTVLLPLGLWVGALAILLVLGGIPSRLLASSVSTARIVRSRFTAVALPAIVQAALMIVLLHVAIGVRPSALPLTIPLALVASLAFAAFHQLLTTAFGRVGLILSLLLLALQIVTVGALYPLEIVSPALSWLSPLMPVTWTADALQAVIAQGAMGAYGGAIAELVVLGLASLLLTGAVLRTRRRARASGVVPATV